MPQPSATNSAMARTAGELIMLFHESAQYQQDPKVQAVLRQAVSSLNAIYQRLQIAESRYVVAVVGLTNVGKSTLLNALLGSDLAPRQNGPCTSVPIEFVFGRTLRLTAYHHHPSVTRHSFECETAAILQERLSQFAGHNGAGTSGNVSKVEVEVPHHLLGAGLVIADTPGFGAAQVGDASGSDEKAVTDYLRRASQVFWIVLAEQGIGEREVQFHDRLFADLCDDIVVTGCEDWSVKDRTRFRRRFETLFTDKLPAFHFVSALDGLRSREAGDAEGLEKAGIVALEKRIRQLAEPSGRLGSLRDALLQLAGDVAFWLQDYGVPLQQRWRPDSWLRWKSGLRSGDKLYQELDQVINPTHKRKT